MNPEAIVTTGLADEIAFRLQRNILDGELPPGSSLPQDELCKRFGVSRTPVREALRKLQAQHLVVVVPNKGARVRVLTRKELIDVYTILAELEAFSAELAAPNMTPATLALLDAAQEEMESIVGRFKMGEIDAEDEVSFSNKLDRANLKFHNKIQSATGNEHLIRMIRDLRSFFPKDYTWQAARVSKEAFHTLNVDEHLRVVERLRDKDAAGARRAMREHVMHAGSALLDHLEKTGFWK